MTLKNGLIFSSPLFRQAINFGLVGGVQLLLDWAVFVGLSAFGLPVVIANLAGRIAGASLGFWLNGRVTFRGDTHLTLVGRPLQRFLLMWVSLTLVSTLAVSGVTHWVGLEYAWIAKPFVEAALAVLSFLICRHWVYR